MGKIKNHSGRGMLTEWYVEGESKENRYWHPASLAGCPTTYWYKHPV